MSYGCKSETGEQAGVALLEVVRGVGELSFTAGLVNLASSVFEF